MADERVQKLIDQLHAKVASLASDYDWKALLQMACNLGNYSANNILLILIQRANATHVEGFKTWQKLGRQVRKGEKGIAILAPRKKWIEKENDEGRLERRLIVTGFSVVHVFDISQTDGPALATPAPMPTLLEGQAPEGLRGKLRIYCVLKGFDVQFPDKWDNDANGYTDFVAKKVAIRPGMSAAQQCKTLAHELGHILVHDGTEYAMGHRGRAEVEAESIAFIICGSQGMNTDDYSLPYVTTWSGGDMKLVLATADRVVKAASEVLNYLGGEQGDAQVAV